MNKICLVCGKTYPRTYHTKSRWAKSKFCSKQCSNIFLGENTKLNNPNKGRIFDEIARKNMSNAHMGKKHTTEQIEKIRQGNIGKHDGNKTYNSTGKHSGELNGMYGKEPWNKGLKNCIVPWNKGIPWSDEVKNKMKEAWEPRRSDIPNKRNSINHIGRPRKSFTCGFESCGRASRTHGLCLTHYSQLRRTGILKPIKKIELKLCIFIGCGRIKTDLFGYCKVHHKQLKTGLKIIEDEKSLRSKDRNPELKKAMNNVRKRDKNHCKWYGCDKQGKGIHVHHIFPRSEYPELELIISYMICYCPLHHARFHEVRGDKFYKLIEYQTEKYKYNENPLEVK